jgi:hypothetical protein
MAHPRQRWPLDLGVMVRRRQDTGGVVGVIVGAILRPSQLALVRWRELPPTFENPEELVEVHSLIR